MKWKAVIHSAVVTVISLAVGAGEQYFENGGAIPTTPQQWKVFGATVAGTVLVGVAALLKQSPIQPKPTTAASPAAKQ